MNNNLNQYQNFLLNFREEMKTSMNNLKLKLLNINIFDVYFKEFEKLIHDHQKIEKKEYMLQRTGPKINNRRPLTPEKLSC